MIEVVYEDSGGALKTVRLLDLSRSHESTSSPTDHPVEDGASITDHVKVEPDTFSAECFVSPSVIEDPGSNLDGATLTTVGVSLPSGNSAALIELSTEIDRAKLVYDELRGVQAARILVSIITPLRRYDDMAITRLGFPITASTGIRFQFEAREVILVQTESVNVPVPRSVRGNADSSVGRQAAEAVSTALRSVNDITNDAIRSASGGTRSGAAAILDGLRG